MVTGIAHELSKPAHQHPRLRAAPPFLRRDSLGGSHEARQIFQEAERASAILRQLLLSRQGTRVPSDVALRLIRLLLALSNFSASTPQPRIFAWNSILDPVLPFVNGDPGQLQQVLMNLIGNFAALPSKRKAEAALSA